MTRVLVVGLDGVNFRMLDGILSDEDVPTISSLTSGGVSADLRSTVPPFTKPAWNSMVTGLNPGKLGMFGLTDDSSGTSVATARSENPYRVWNLLSGKRGPVVVNNVPPIVSADDVDGDMVAGGLYQSDQLNKDAVHPSTLFDAVRETGVGNVGFQEIMKQPIPEFLDTLYEYTETNVRCLELLLNHVDDWRFCMTVFFGPDQIMHKLWPSVDPDHPRHEEIAQWEDEFREYWHQLDEHVSRVLERTDDETTVLLVSDHGFGPVSERFAVNSWLEQEGLLARQSHNPTASSDSSLLAQSLLKIGLTKYRALQILKTLNVEQLQTYLPERVREMVPRDEDWQPFDDELVDWKRTKAYSSGSTGAIYLNTVEGERSGDGVIPLEEYEAVREGVIDRLQDVAETHGFELRIWKPEDIYEGPHVEQAPDVLYTLDDMTVLPTPAYHDPPFFYSETAPPIGAAHHRRSGMFVANGPVISPEADVDTLSILDIAPTILHLFDTPIPNWVDGDPRTELFVEKLANRDPGNTELQSLAEKEPVSTQTLRDLGYIE